MKKSGHAFKLWLSNPRLTPLARRVLSNEFNRELFNAKGNKPRRVSMQSTQPRNGSDSSRNP